MYAECRHILPRGTKCKSPALRGKFYCYFHDNLHRFAQDGNRFDKEPVILPSLEDNSGIQIALTQVLSALGSGRIERRLGGLYLYGLQIAAQLAARVTDAIPQEIVRTTACDDTGVILAPEQTACEPGVDCDTCKVQASCLNLTRIDTRSDERVISSMRDGQDRWKQDAQKAESGPEHAAKM